MNETLKTILNRKSIRDYTDKPVSKADLILLLKAAMAAPSGGDTRSWSFFVIQNKALLKELSDILKYGHMIREAGAVIVVCGNPKKSTFDGDQYWMFDCSVAAENILLAAESLGLGAVWTAVYPNKVRIKNVKKVLNTPKEIEPLCTISIGHPKSKVKPKNKFDPKNIHWNKW
ncbi:MAG: nitroreductase family protein [Patescibacteria group bacterium]|jgi:nitroreductase